ncbi:ACT domain-containing protein [Azospirillum argentinense]|uniref:ACT domain-containing protein n=1 Tax=Azospirillum argentinense TaxID=2970906 RepID=A0A4D8PAU9_9PROT|nr:ACT domain-containing protein [Azospirillum argentinense]QCN94404.1 ACT domain-containing protein [Azospirillum argentinense]
MSTDNGPKVGGSKDGGLAKALALGGDRRAFGDIPTVAEAVAADPARLPELVACLFDGDAGVRMRAADALERVSRGDARPLDAFAERLLTDAAAIEQAEVRWHLAAVLPRLTLTEEQRGRAVALLEGWFENRASRIVQSAALQAMVDLAADDPELRPVAADMLGRAMRSRIPSLAARAKRILKPFEVDRATLDAALLPETKPLTLSLLPDRLAVARLAPGDGMPGWLDWTDPLVSATRTGEELSILCREARVPDGVTAERGWRAFKVEGPLDFSLFGVLARIAVPLAQARVPMFAMSTYDTDYVLVRDEDVERAADALKRVCTVVAPS